MQISIKNGSASGSIPSDRVPGTDIGRRRALATLGAACTAPIGAWAQQEGRVRLIVPTSAGGATDATARALQPGLASALGVPVIVENVPGASGVLGLQTVARSSPQEMTLAVITNSVAILPSVMRAFPFDTSRDFTPIAMLASIPMALAVNPKVPATNAKELIALLKQQPDVFAFGSSGAGSISHLTTEMFLDEAGAKARHIPYQGPSPMTVGLIGGQIEFASQGLPVFQPHAKAGTLRVIGICSTQRSPVAPDTPTFVEQGLPGLVAEAWVTLLGPKGMAPALVKKLHEAAAKAFGTPEAQERLAQQGSVVALGTPEDARATIARDVARYAALVKKIGLEPQ